MNSLTACENKEKSIDIEDKEKAEGETGHYIFSQGDCFSSCRLDEIFIYLPNQKYQIKPSL